jgi:hypothetical protein
MIHLTKCKHQ